MSLYVGEPTVWMRAIRWHTYDGVPQPDGAYYLAHEEMVETIEKVLKFAVRDEAPPQAAREPAPPPAS